MAITWIGLLDYKIIMFCFVCFSVLHLTTEKPGIFFVKSDDKKQSKNVEKMNTLGK